MLRISPAYSSPFTHAFAVQAVLILGAILLPVLDGGELSKLLVIVLGCCFAGFWLGVIFILRRRQDHPTRYDLLWIRFGSLALPLACAAISIVASFFKH